MSVSMANARRNASLVSLPRRFRNVAQTFNERRNPQGGLFFDASLINRIPGSDHLGLEFLIDALMAPVELLQILYPLEVRNRYAAGVGENVGNHDRAAPSKRLIGARCYG